MYKQVAPRGGRVLGVAMSEDSPASLKQFRQRNKVAYPIAIDKGNRMFGRFPLQGIPATVLIDRNGVIQHIDDKYSAAGVARSRQKFLALLRGTKGRVASLPSQPLRVQLSGLE